MPAYPSPLRMPARTALSRVAVLYLGMATAPAMLPAQNLGLTTARTSEGDCDPPARTSHRSTRFQDVRRRA